ncbi:MAG: ABC transporter permease [Thermomicrobiales bacterium]|nr:ABC transporter permease [Thermomicrobiales bacterium]
MTGYMLRRLLVLIPTLLVVTLVVFALIRLSGDPTALLLAPEATEQDRAAFRAAKGLDAPLPVQYVRFLQDALRGDFGTSLWQHEPATTVVMRHFPATLQLSAAAMAIVLIVGLPLGIVAAVRRASLLDSLTMGFVAIGQSIATFWLGLMLILIFAVKLRWFPPSGRGGLDSIVLPAVTLSAYYLAVTARLVRSGMLEVLSRDYMRVARAKGLTERNVVLRHGLRNVLIPVTTVLGLQLGELLAGAVVTEAVFAWPGIGTLVLDAIGRRDYPVVQAVIIVIAVSYALINLAIDMLYALLDPRISTR